MEDVSLGLRQCALLNISVCEATVEATAEGRGFRCACRRWHQSNPMFVTTICCCHCVYQE